MKGPKPRPNTAQKSESKLSKLEMLAGQVGVLAGTAAHYTYKGLEYITPDNTPKDYNYFATSQYAKLGGAVSAGLIADAALSKAEDKLRIPKKMKGLAAMAGAVVGYAALKHFFLESGANYGETFIGEVVQTYGDYWRAIASVVASEPRVSVPDLIGGTVMATTTAKTLKNLITGYK